MAATRCEGPNMDDKYNASKKPKRILLFSGKRKSGKDYITDLLHERIGSEKSVIIKLSGPIKAHWAKTQNLDLNELLGAGTYKEEHRLQMLKWSENVRRNDYSYFCRAAVDMYNAYDKPLWIVSDVRRKTDIQWFTENFGNICKTIRIVCSNNVRQERGWIYTRGIDDAETECNLDDINKWDLKITNNNDEDVEIALKEIIKLIESQ